MLGALAVRTVHTPIVGAGGPFLEAVGVSLSRYDYKARSRRGPVFTFARLVDLVGALARPAAAGAVPLTCAGRPWRRLQVGSDGALLGCDGRRVVGDHP